MNENTKEIQSVDRAEAPVAVRSAWKRPEVIVSQVRDSELGPSANPDATNGS